jgi:hypothetical protein
LNSSSSEESNSDLNSSSSKESNSDSNSSSSEESNSDLNSSSSEESDSDSNSSSSEESDSDSNNKKCNLLEVLDDILKTNSYRKIADSLNVSVGTITRWKKLENVPIQYQFDLMKLNNIKINYSKYDYNEKDQFYTPKETAKYCFEVFKKVLNELKDDEKIYTYIEPSAGSGNFLKVLPKNRIIALDIEPYCKKIMKKDYLLWKPSIEKKYVVFGNPPFGLRGHLALKFINHSYDFADYVCFILPQLFESDGKGVPRKRVNGYFLIYSEKLDTFFYSPCKKEIKVNCIFQIWSKNYKSDKYLVKKVNTDILKIYSLSDGGSSSTTRNKKMFHKCDVYIPSTIYGKENMRYYDTFEELPRKKGYGILFNKNKEENIPKFKSIDWSEVAFLSTNSAYNIRTSQIEKLFN